MFKWRFFGETFIIIAKDCLILLTLILSVNWHY
jgi:hypothetical protein